MDELVPLIGRIAAALERMAPASPDPASLKEADAFVWNGGTRSLAPVRAVSGVAIGLLRGIDRQRDLVVGNTLRFAGGKDANNVCCGARAGWASHRWSRRRMGRQMHVSRVRWR